MQLTVAICTWNRAQLLDQTLEQFQQMDLPTGVEWELLVVNNRCTDHTEEVVKRHSNSLPLRRVFEDRPGLSHARNCAVAAARGELVLWTDDDVLASPEWLACYLDAAAQSPTVAVFGGPIRPWFPQEPPPWLRQCWQRVASVYGACDHGDITRPLSADTLPFGGNFAVRRSVLAQFPFDPNLGVCGKSRKGGEEIAVVLKILQAGYRGVWIPKALIRHYVPPERQTLGHVRRHFFGQGQMWVAMDPTPTAKVTTIFGWQRWLVKKAILAELRYRVRRWTKKPEVWIEDLIEASMLCGRLYESRKVT